MRVPEVARYTRSIGFWNRYKQRYPDTNPDHFIEAEYRLLKLQEGQGDAVSSICAERAVKRGEPDDSEE